MNDIKDEYQRVYARINLDAINYNMQSIFSALKEDTRVIAVLKTDGYGHGAIPIARELEKMERVYGFALATAEEALILRNSGIRKPLLVLGYTFPNVYEELIQKNVSLTVFREDMLEDIVKACRRISTTEYKYIAHVHIKTDTGMGRIGVTPDDAGLDFVKKASGFPELKIDGLFTHLSRADEPEPGGIEFTKRQIDKYINFSERIKNELGLTIPLHHILNSAGIIDYPQADLDLVRAGIIIYGLWPSGEPSEKISLKPVLSLHSQIVYIKEVEAGTSISYGGIFVSERKMKIATVPVGYGEGYPRTLSGKADVLIRGVRCPILGRICMDQMMVDVSHLSEVSEGDRVTLIGSDGNESITMEELGKISGRFNYEMACDLGKRIPRVFTKNNMVLTTKDYYEDF